MRTRLLISLAALFGSLAISAPPAGATITKTAITTPSSDPTYLINRGNTTLKIAGTAVSDAASSDQVDIWCYHDDGDAHPWNPQPLVQGIPLSSTGHFSAVVGLPSYFSGACRLRAVPTNTFPTSGLSAFSGPRIVASGLRVDTVDGLDGVQSAYDFTVLGAQLGGGMELQSAGDWGLSSTEAFGTNVLGQGSATEFYGNAWFMNPSDMSSSGSSDNSSIQVDGLNAYTPYAAHEINSNASGLPSLGVDVQQNPSNGALTVTDTEPLVTCPGVAWAGQGGPTCSAFAPAGVELDRTILLGGNGRVVTVDDRFVSVDGGNHQVAALYRNRQQFSDSSWSPDNPVGYEFPGQTSFATHTSGDGVGVAPGSPASLVIRDLGRPVDDPNSGTGSLTWSETPKAIRFLEVDASSFDAGYSFDVPATGPGHELRQVYVTELTAAAVKADDLAIDDVLVPPAITIGAPVAGSAFSRSPVTVTGTAGAGSGVRSVTVNGVRATVGGGGTYSVKVPLKSGRNTLLARLTSASGRSATARVRVTLTRAGVRGAAVTLPTAIVQSHVLQRGAR